MAERQIVKYGDPVLREVSKKVEKIDQGTKDLVSDMIDTLKEASGLGLAAVQIGVLLRVFIIDLAAIDPTASLKAYINPEILKTSQDEVEMEEGCLSFPGIYQKISRPESVRIRATGLDGKVFEETLHDLAARAVLHEYDHIEGKLFIDYLSPFAKTLLSGKLKKLATAS
ncbi:MAG TPA: peptide deformylase [candidate division Zixibacteria bacterium]|nr:peptide deformylase [candidate division Zixibacteria bacterium]